MNKINENQDFQKGNHARNALMLLQNVSGKVWQNLVVFSSVVNRQEFFGIVGPVCGRRRPFQDWTERLATAIVGSNGLYQIQSNMTIIVSEYIYLHMVFDLYSVFRQIILNVKHGFYSHHVKCVCV